MGSDATTIRKALEETDQAMLATFDEIKATYGARLVAIRIDGAGINIGWFEWERVLADSFELRASSSADAARHEWEEIKTRARVGGGTRKGRR